MLTMKLTIETYCLLYIVHLYASYILFIYRYKAEQKEYENHIANLETNQVKNELEIKELQKELKKYKDLVNNQSSNAMADTLTVYKEELRETYMLLQNEKEKFLQKEKKEKTLMDKLTYREIQYEELRLDLQVK